MNLNKVILIGRIASDLNASMSKSGINFVRFSLAITRDVNSYNKTNEITDFIPCAAFRNNATFLSKYFNKGDLVNIIGSIQMSQYKNKNDEIQNTFTIIVDQIKGLESRSITQSRLDKQNKSDDSEIVNEKLNDINYDQPTFYEKNDNFDDDDENPWELDL